MKKINLVILCLIFIVTLSSCSRHIADTNGNDDFSLTTISTQNIVESNNCVKSGAVKIQKGTSTSVKAKKFSGVETLHTFQLNSSSLHMVVDARVNSGNLRLLLCNKHDVLDEIAINSGKQEVNIPVTADTVYLKVAGESANFAVNFDYEVTMSKGIYI